MLVDDLAFTRGRLGRFALLSVSGLAATLLVTGNAARAASCAPADHPGGDWRSYGHDLSNTRHQDRESVIDAARAPFLAPSWVFSTGGSGDVFQNTPVVADGCAYLASSQGNIFAVNADTGELVWKTNIPVEAAGGGGVFVGSPAVSGGRVYALVNELNGPFAVALDQATGGVLWTSARVDNYPGLRTNASAVVSGGVLFFGYSVPEGDADAHAGFVVVDAATGAIIKRTFVIPQEDWQYGYGGGGIWTTAAVDPETKYAYVGTSNPTSKVREHERINAVLKIDIDRDRATVGEVVDVYKGNVDQYFPGLDRQPVCRTVGPYEPSFALTCFQLDLDFGASPNLFRDFRGKKVVGILQKSGVYHAVYADTMEMDWTAIVGLPCIPCNASSTAFDGTNIYAEGTPPGQMVALEKDFGGYAWASPVGDAVHYQPVSSANGVIYTVDAIGALAAYAAATGLPLLRRPFSVDVGAPVATAYSSSGVSIARNTVFAAASTYAIAYR